MIIFCKNIPVVSHVKVADTFTKKLFGLMGRTNIDSDEGLLLMHCSSIHCFFMRIPIDVVYISKSLRILGMETVMPWHVGKRFKKTLHILELKAGTSNQKFTVGDKLILCEFSEK